jgi:hypothetical protein
MSIFFAGVRPNGCINKEMLDQNILTLLHQQGNVRSKHTNNVSMF